MNFEYVHLLPSDFAPESRVWIYQSNRLFTLSEALDIESAINEFCEEWRTHGSELKAFGNLFFGQFIILMIDESKVGISGCSTDSSVHFIKELGKRYNVDFFNRMNLAFIVKEKLEVLPLTQLQYAIDNGFITPETLYFNNLVQTKKELENNWIIPVEKSWLQQKMKKAV
jgi:hypothetical protein